MNLHYEQIIHDIKKEILQNQLSQGPNKIIFNALSLIKAQLK